MFQDVSGCSGMFHVPDFIDGRLSGALGSLSKPRRRRRRQRKRHQMKGLMSRAIADNSATQKKTRTEKLQCKNCLGVELSLKVAPYSSLPHEN